MKSEDPFHEYFGVGGKTHIYLVLIIGFVFLIYGIVNGINWYKTKLLSEKRFSSLENKVILSNYESEYDGLELNDTLINHVSLLTHDSYHDVNPIISLQNNLILFESNRPDCTVNRKFKYNRLWVYEFKNSNFTPGFEKYKQLIQNEYSEIRSLKPKRPIYYIFGI